MKNLRRFPTLEGPLRDGRICLTTVNLLGPLLTEENLADLVGRAAFLSRAETEKLVVSIQPRAAPRDGIRRLPAVGRAGHAASAASAREVPPLTAPDGTGSGSGGTRLEAALPASAGAQANRSASPSGGEGELTLLAPADTSARPRAATRAELRPISADLYSLRVTLDSADKAELDQLIALSSHTTRGDLAAVVREAIRCGLAKHGKRKGAVPPERMRAGRKAEGATPETPAKPEKVENAEKVGKAEKADTLHVETQRTAAMPGTADKPEAAKKPLDPRAIPAAVRREVWKRDGGRCAWTSPNEKRCGSTFMLELDHITPVALGGLSTADNLQVACRPHNQYEAVRIFGREHMAPYLGEFTPAGGSHA